jgi:capsular exopolysaccharide synthesis family protein
MWVLIAAGFVGLALGVGIYFSTLTISPQYTSKAQLSVELGPSEIQTLDPGQTENVRNETLRRFIGTQIETLRSEDVLRRALKQEAAQRTAFVKNLKSRIGEGEGEYWLARGQRLMREELLTARMVPDTRLMEVSVSTQKPEDARYLLKALTDVYLERVEDEHENQSTNLRQVFIQERDRAEQVVQNLQERKAEFRSNNSIETVDSARTETAIRYRRFAEQQAQLEAMLSQAQSSYQSMREAREQGNLELTPEEVTQLEELPVIQRRMSELSRVREQLEVQRQRYGENHRSVQDLRRQVAAVEAEKDRLMEEKGRQLQQQKLQAARERVQSTKTRLSENQGRLETASARLTDLGNKLNRFRAIEDQLEMAKERRQRASESLNELQLQAGSPQATPVQMWIPPNEPELTSPTVKVAIAGTAVLVLVLTTGGVFLWEVLDQRLRSPAEVSLATEAELLGVIPDADEDPAGRWPIERVVERRPRGLLAECFRQVQTAVVSKMDRRGLRTLMVVGAQPACGCSSVAQDLGVSLARNGRGVLIVDCNFRRPRQHELADLTNDAGLVDVLRGQSEIVPLIAPLAGTNLSVMSTGQAQYAEPELLESDRFRAMLTELERQFDVVLLDAPPTLLTSEARMLAKQVDAVVGVVRADREKRGMVGRMLRQLAGHRAEVLGLILNGARSASGGYFRKSYQAFSRYGANGRLPRDDSPRTDAAPAEQVL